MIRVKDVDLWQVTARMKSLGLVAPAKIKQSGNALIVFAHPFTKGRTLSIGADGSREGVS